MTARYWRQQNRLAKTSLGVFLLCGAVALVAYLVASSLKGQPGPLGQVMGVTQILAFASGVVALCLQVMQLVSSWRRSRAPLPAPTSAQTSTAKDVLAGLVAQQWRDETALRSLCDPAPMPLAWRSTERRELADRSEIIAEGTVAFSGLDVHIEDMVRNFRALRCRRLVILGGPGTGKTTLAVQLVLELLRTREPDEPVPVLLSAARWDDRAHPRLQDWLAASLAMDYPAMRAAELGTDIPETLVARGEILPVIDGLDELPDHARADLLSALNRSMCGNDQLILTCRTEQFAESVDELGDVLTAAAVIEPQPMGPGVAADYLQACLPPVPHPAWPAVIEALRMGAAPVLAEVTSTSLGLWLVRATYIAPRVNPSPLLQYVHGSAAELQDHLCDQLIPALVSTRPPADGPVQPFRPRHAWTPEQVGRWLTYVCRQLAVNEDDTRDMAWWHLAGRMPNRTMRLWCGVGIGVVTGLVLFLLTDGMVLVGVVAGLLAALVVIVMTGSWFTEAPGHAELQWRGRLAELARVLMAGLVVGLVGAILGWLVGWSLGNHMAEAAWRAARNIGLLTGIGFLIVFSLIRWVEHPTVTATARSPRSTWRADRTLTVIRMVSGLVVGLMAGFIAREAQLPTTVAIVGGLLLGLLFGLVVGRHHAWLAYNLTVPRLAAKGSLPMRAMDFLDDAHRLGLLRTEGPYYQFRHIELQQHLTRELQEKRTAKPSEPAPHL
ncbi:NACHT domain-containing protein [Nonomuraea fuscirosea]|uniref:NACHT domain-containing protein n=1 Tax=Nonomuraea fuscirosea TaxID=1291556 RepID=UPI00343048D8